MYSQQHPQHTAGPVPWRIWATATAHEECICGAAPGVECACVQPGAHLDRIATAWTERRISKGDMDMAIEVAKEVPPRGVFTALTVIPGCAA